MQYNRNNISFNTSQNTPDCLLAFNILAILQEEMF